MPVWSKAVVNRTLQTTLAANGQCYVCSLDTVHDPGRRTGPLITVITVYMGKLTGVVAKIPHLADRTLKISVT